MATLSTRPLVDRLIPGGLENFLVLARENGDSFHAICLRLAREHNISVTPPTVRKWCIHYGVPGCTPQLIERGEPR